jgi:hypothetical protein
VKDRLQPLTGELSELDCSLSREAEALLQRVQDLLSQKFGKSATFDDCVKSMAKEFIWRHDPVERAERLHLKVQAPGALRVTVKNGKRTSVPQSEVHQLFHRTKGQCTFDGRRPNFRGRMSVGENREGDAGGPEHHTEPTSAIIFRARQSLFVTFTLFKERKNLNSTPATRPGLSGTALAITRSSFGAPVAFWRYVVVQWRIEDH